MEARSPGASARRGLLEETPRPGLPRIGPERSLDPRRDFGAPVSIKTIMLL